jgi:hypothetical protein
MKSIDTIRLGAEVTDFAECGFGKIGGISVHP